MSVRAVRPGEAYFFLIPPPAGVGAFLAQHEWVTGIVVVTSLTLLGILARFFHILNGEIAKEGFWQWREDREAYLDSQVDHKVGRRRRKLEGKQQRRELEQRIHEFERDEPSWWDQLKLFR